ncbi:MAG: MAC/perforin domain-containing protein [Steroidobacteraceae bacterium]
MNRIRTISLWVAQAAGVMAMQAVANDAGRPAEAFSGCDTVVAAAPKIVASRQRITEAATRVDALTNREFASFSVDELEGSLRDEDIDQCWFRLDGVWREDVPISLDTDFVPEGWSSAHPELVHLANGTYTTPLHVVVLPSTAADNMLQVMLAEGDARPVSYVSDDGVTLRELLENRGRTKVYSAPPRALAPGLAPTLTVDVTRTGYLRLRMGRASFYRPAPGTVSKVSGDDPFMIGYTMENLRANRTGYDVTTQNPNRLLQNPKSEVFDFATDRGAVIDQRRVVPLGLKLVKEETQGTVFYSTNVSSEREYQQMTQSTFGNSTRIGVSGQVGGGREGGASGNVSIEAGFGWGSDSAKRQFKSLQESKSVAEEVGYMRFKKLALVLDPAYAPLTDRFIDAVADAQRQRDFSELLAKFGTHYAYSITYGAAGEVRQRLTSQAFARRRAKSDASSSNERGAFIVGESSAYRSSETRSESTFRESNEFGERTFDAVGGNGSWDQNGFSAGDAHYPILADLRPLSDLLNPINFPDQPEVYGPLRREFARAIDRYMVARATLSEQSLIPPYVSPPAEAPRSPFDQVITITTANNTRETLRQTFRANAVDRGIVRICVTNRTGGERLLAHNFQPRINPFRLAARGGSNCANFPANSRVTFELFAAGRRVQTDRRMSYDTRLLAGGRMELVWQ